MNTTQAYEVNIFSGGITDNYLSGPSNQYRFAHNFVITRNQKLYTRPGSRIYLNNDPQIPLGAQRISALINLNNEYLFSQVQQELYYIQAKTDMYTQLLGPSGNEVFSIGDDDTRVSWGIWNNHLIVANSDFAKPMKIYEDDVGDLQVRNCGLPALASNPTATPSMAGANNYLYAFIYVYEYKNKNTTFIDASPVTIVEVNNSDAPDVNQIAIAAIPTLTNGAGDNYDTVNVTVEIYRTLNNGDVFYFVTSLANGVPTYNDNNSDASIENNITLYTTDGTVDTYPAPLAKYVHVTNNLAYYAHIKESATEIKPNRVFQSFPSNPDSIGNNFFVDVEDEIVGLSSYDYTPLVFCRFSTYRLDGVIQEDGSGFLEQQKISDTVGCVSNLSIVRTRQGTFFAGTDGFYGTDGYRVEKVSGEFDSRYLNLLQNNRDKIYGVYDEENSRILWAVQNAGGSGDNDYIYCYDLRFGEPSKTFTTWGGDDTSESFRPSALAYYNRSLLRADTRGYIFEHLPTVYTDPRIDILEDPADWAEETIIYNYESCATNFGSDFYRKWVPKIIVTADADTNLTLGIRSVNDDERIIQDLKPIMFNNIIIWGDPDIIWGDEELLWNYQGVIQEQRRFPAPGIRCSFKSIIFTNALTTIDDSTISGTATIDATLKEVVLDTAGFEFSSRSVGYFIAFSSDDYARTYTIVSVSGNTLVYSDPTNQSVDGTFDWVMTGYPKDDVLNLIGYIMHYFPISQTQVPYISS